MFNYLGFRTSDLEFTSIPDGIDVNMGCPAREVTKVGAGAALLKNPELAALIIKSVKKATKLPVSVKTRLGWNDPTDILTFCRMLEGSGADALVIHARTYQQFFSGQPDWQMVYQVKKQLKIPVILNGGIYSLEDYQKVDLDKIDGVMIGRGALGKPWIFDEVKNPKLRPKTKELRTDLNLIKKTVLEHAGLVYQLKGQQGIKELRKHLAWYFRGIPNSRKVRNKLVTVNSLEEIKKILTSFQL